MDYIQIITSKHPEELYQQALQFKESQDYDNYHMYLIMAANLNYQPAISELHNDYLFVEKQLFKKHDYNKYKDFYEKTKEYSYSLNFLGYIDHDTNEAFAAECYTKAYEMGNPIATFNLAVMYRKGTYFEKNWDKSVELYTTAGKMCPDIAYISMLQVAVCYYDQKDYDKAEEYYLKAIEYGDLKSHSSIGLLYFDGLGREKNYKKALEHFQKASDVGCKCALVHLIKMYCHGIGVEKDYDKVKVYLDIYKEKHGETGSYFSSLGYMYLHGNGYKQDWDKAKELFEKSVEKGDSCEGHVLLGDLLREVDYLDYDRAIKLYEKAIEMCKDWAVPYARLGNVHLHGRRVGFFERVDQDPVKAIEYYEKAVELGCKETAFDLSKYFFHGYDGIPKDWDKAKIFAEKCGKKGLYFLAKIAHEKEGNLEKAMDLYERSAQGREYAWEELFELPKIYKILGKEKVSVEHVVNFLASVNDLKSLSKIYEFNDKIVNLVIEHFRLNKENQKFREYISTQEGGKEYLDQVNFNVDINELDDIDLQSLNEYEYIVQLLTRYCVLKKENTQFREYIEKQVDGNEYLTKVKEDQEKEDSKNKCVIC